MAVAGVAVKFRFAERNGVGAGEFTCAVSEIANRKMARSFISKHIGRDSIRD